MKAEEKNSKRGENQGIYFFLRQSEIASHWLHGNIRPDETEGIQLGFPRKRYEWGEKMMLPNFKKPLSVKGKKRPH